MGNVYILNEIVQSRLREDMWCGSLSYKWNVGIKGRM